MSIYTKTVDFSIAAGTVKCIELPTVPRGKIKRVVITQVSGTAIAATVRIYDRKGASVAANDIETADAGIITAYANSGGSVQFTTEVAHGLSPGDVIEIKNCPNAAFNVDHTVVSITSSTQFVTDIAYGTPTAIGTPNPKVLYQTKPFLTTQKPVTHLLYSASISSGTDLAALDLDISFENRDNQSSVSRTRNSALWLDFTTAGSGAASTWQVSITTESITLF